MELPKCFYRISVKALIFDESRTKFLLAKENKGTWEMPGGGIDWGEDARECLKREIFEEMGLEPTWIAEKPSHFFSFQCPKGIPKAQIIYEVTLKDLDFTSSDECVALQFCTIEMANELQLLPSNELVIQAVKISGIQHVAL
jgi:8-oxo-dGTP diphosphatase